MEKTKLYELLNEQQELFNKEEELIEREISLEPYLRGNEIVIISGIRRCGKSTLLKIISNKINKKKIYINFDDVRFTDFKIENFQDIEDFAKELHSIGSEVVFFFDEIQNIPSWERWVNNLFAKKIKVFVTGSNSSLLSSEISTFLTGRNKVLRLYPFSFKEFLRFKNIQENPKTSNERIILMGAFEEYFEKGGFPLVIKNNDLELSKQYFEDILNKDIIQRYHIKKTKEIKDLILYLFSNVGKVYSYSTLKIISGIKSLSMIKNYIEYMKGVFLASTINRFDYSLKKQQVSSSKFYVLDNSFLKTVAFNFIENRGQRLENLVFIELLKEGFEVYYHLGKKECDFIVKKGLKITQAIQVCLNLESPMTKKREIEGLLEAMQKYTLKEGIILTLDKEGEENINGKKIIIKPVWKWLLAMNSARSIK
ncbi:MAG: ATP-binding protein [Nanoarchaeota archaeon]|nr:ATP-binding protein [Nanoarchaeota archaeon]